MVVHVLGGCWGFLGLSVGYKSAFPVVLPLCLGHRLSPAIVCARLSVDIGPAARGKMMLDLQVEVTSVT